MADDRVNSLATHGREQNDGFVTHPAFGWTIARHVGAFVLLSLCLGLVVMLVPDLRSLLGVTEEFAKVQAELPASVLVFGNMTRLFVATFSLLLWLAAAPIVGAILGVSTAVGARAPRAVLAVAAGIGSFLGYLFPFVIVAITLSIVMPASESGALLGVLIGGFLMSFPTGIAAGGMTFLSHSGS